MHHVSEFQSTSPEFAEDWKRLSDSEAKGLEEESRAVEYGLARCIERADEHGQAAFLFRRARVTLNRGDHQRGLEELREAIDHAQRIGNRRWEGIGRVFMGISLSGMGADLESVRQLYQGVDLLHNIVGCEIDYVRAAMEVINLNVRLGRIEEVRDHAAELIAFIDEHQLPLVPADVNGLAQTLVVFGELDRAEELYRQNIDDPRSSQARVAHAESGIARIKARQGKQEEVEKLYQQALLREVPLPTRIGITLDLAATLRSSGRNDEAVHWIDKVLADPSMSQRVKRYGELLTSKAKCLQHADPEQAVDLLLEAIRIQTFDEEPERELERLRILMVLLESLRDHERTASIVFELAHRSVEVQQSLVERSRENLFLLSEINQLQARDRSREIVEQLHAERTAAVASITQEYDRVVNGVKSILTDAKDLTEAQRDFEALLRGTRATIDDAHSLEAQFRKDHPRFIALLQQRYPTLTPAEVRVCVFLALGMKSDKIATLLYRSVRSIENHRLRIRKKLRLGPEEGIEGVLKEISAM